MSNCKYRTPCGICKAKTDADANAVVHYCKYPEKCEDNSNKAIEKIKDAIIRTDRSDDYSIGLRNGMRLAISCITGEEPKFEHTYMRGEEE